MEGVQQPSLEIEGGLWRESGREGWLLIAVDEVGRGACAGAVAVGAVALDVRRLDSFPKGLADSKLLSAKVRDAMCDPIRAWVRAWAVGFVSAEVIDREGIIAALRSAGKMAIRQVVEEVSAEADVVLLDGAHNYLGDQVGRVVTVVRGDLQCASLAAASVLAKVQRDSEMRSLAVQYPEYGFEHNVGYLTAAHRSALARVGPCAIHRMSFGGIRGGS
jgi:ribonuclease HII